MASFKLHTTPLSVNSLSPELVLAEKGITDYEVVAADIATDSHKVSQNSLAYFLPSANSALQARANNGADPRIYAEVAIRTSPPPRTRRHANH
jgi:hypothetical protein